MVDKTSPPEPREPAAREWLEKNGFPNPVDWMIEMLAAYSAELRAERDAAVDMLRVLMEETILAGYPGGDRNQTLANVRNMKRSLLKARELLNAYRQKRAVDGGGCKTRTWDAGEHLRWDTVIDKLEFLASTSAPEGT